MKMVKEDEQVLFEDERQNFKFRCKPESYDFGFAENLWIRNCSWRVGVDKRELSPSSLRLDELSLGSGVDKLGKCQWIKQKWSGELRAEVEFKFYGEGVILAIFRIIDPPGRLLEIDFPLFSEDSVNENLYVAAIQSSDERGVWPIIRIEKPKNALKRLLKANEDSTEYLPFWVYNEGKTIVILPADNFIDTRFVCKKEENTRELSCELSGIPNGSFEHKVMIFYSSKGPSEALVEAVRVLWYIEAIYIFTELSDSLHLSHGGNERKGDSLESFCLCGKSSHQLQLSCGQFYMAECGR